MHIYKSDLISYRFETSAVKKDDLKGSLLPVEAAYYCLGRYRDTRESGLIVSRVVMNMMTYAHRHCSDPDKLLVPIKQIERFVDNYLTGKEFYVTVSGNIFLVKNPDDEDMEGIDPEKMPNRFEFKSDGHGSYIISYFDEDRDLTNHYFTWGIDQYLI
jgi:hypothetical protein